MRARSPLSGHICSRGDLGRGLARAEVKALTFGTSESAQPLQLSARLDSFRYRRDAERISDTDHGPHDRFGLGAPEEGGHERPVGLDAVEAEAAQISER